DQDLALRIATDDDGGGVRLLADQGQIESFRTVVEEWTAIFGGIEAGLQNDGVERAVALCRLQRYTQLGCGRHGKDLCVTGRGQSQAQANEACHLNRKLGNCKGGNRKVRDRE